MLLSDKMVLMNNKKVCKTQNWALSFTGNAGSSRHPSSRQQTIEVWEDTLHVKKAVYEPLSNAHGMIIK